MELDFSALSGIRANRPLLHCVSNLVTATDCANLALAVGARPVMAQEPAEMEEIAKAALGCVLNTGTPDDAKFEACRRAGRAAEAAGRPLVLDPVGAGASRYRREHLKALLLQVHPTLIRCNFSEARALLELSGGECGVDSVLCATQEESLELAARLARRFDCTVLLSGNEDLVTNGSQCAFLSGGSPLMAHITGAGCMLSVLCCAFLTQSASPFEGAAAAASFWKSCASTAQQAVPSGGCGSFHTALFDAASLLTPQAAAQLAKARFASL